MRDFIKQAHDIARRDAAIICADREPKDGLYWNHWASATSPDESDTFTKFYDQEDILSCVHMDAIEAPTNLYLLLSQYNKLVENIAKGKKYDTYTGKTLQKRREEQYLHIISQACKYCQLSP